MALLITNGRIATMDSRVPTAEAAVAVGDYFAYVGEAAGAKEFLRVLPKEPVETLDLGGRLLTPGFHDSHMHYLHYVRAKVLATELSGARSLAGMLDLLRAAAQSHDPGSERWIVGEGWNQERFCDEKRFPTRRDLDRVSRDIPILAMRGCFHVGVLNSKAMELMHIDEHTDAFGEYAGRQEDGALNGVFLEQAIDDIKKDVPAPGIEELTEMMCACQKDLFACGITSIQSDDLKYVCEGSAHELLYHLRDAAQRKKLRLRMGEQCLLDTPEAQRAFFDEGFDHNFGGDTFHISCVKLLADGSLGARTALMSKPYADAPDTRGLSVYTQEELNALVLNVHRRNMPVAIHAIGDGAVEMALNAIERAQRLLPGLHPRHGVVHCQITDRALIRRFADLGATAFIQPVFIDSDMDICAARVGEETASTSYGWKEMLCQGICAPFGTDCPVESFDVRQGLWCAVTRRSVDGKRGPFLPEQALTLEQAVHAYTALGAWAEGMEGRKGKILPGMLADFAVWDRDMFALPPQEILRANVTDTFVAGERVYCAE